MSCVTASAASGGMGERADGVRHQRALQRRSCRSQHRTTVVLSGPVGCKSRQLVVVSEAQPAGDTPSAAPNE